MARITVIIIIIITTTHIYISNIIYISSKIIYIKQNNTHIYITHIYILNIIYISNKIITHTYISHTHVYIYIYIYIYIKHSVKPIRTVGHSTCSPLYY